MADIAGNAPLPLAALAPAAAVLNQRALVPAQQGGKGQTRGAVPTPDNSVFDKSWFADPQPGKPAKDDIFGRILHEHNVRAGDFAAMRHAVLLAVGQELVDADAGKPSRTNFLDTAATLLSRNYGTGNLAPGAVRPPSAKLGLKAMNDLLLGEFAKGAIGAYDAFTGWWGGRYHSGPGENDFVGCNLHIWDPEAVLVETDAAGLPTIQSVQAVTQVSREIRAAATENWFVSADRLRTQPECLATADFAINVWSAEDDLTGYVWKGPWRHAGSDSPEPSTKLPHIGFRLAADTLLWIATVEPVDDVVTTKNLELYMFVEWGMPRDDFSGFYNIRGAFCKTGTSWQGANIDFGGKFGVTDSVIGYNDYAQIAQYADRASFKSAQARNFLKGSGAAAIKAALEM